MKLFSLRMLKLAVAFVLVMSVQGAATIPAPVSDIVRQLQEWRNMSAGLMGECIQKYSTNDSVLSELKITYIEASSIANSLIDQFQLEAASKTRMEPKRYAPHIERAKTASERLITQAKLLLTSDRKTRGPTSAGTNTSASAGASPAKTSEPPSLAPEAMETTRQSVALLSGVMDIVGKNRKVFADLASEQRKEVSKMLVEQKWAPLDQVLGRSKPAVSSGPAPSATSENKPKK